MRSTAHEKARDWTPAACAGRGEGSSSLRRAGCGGKLPSAIYDAGLAYQRCGDDKEAKARFTTGARCRPEVRHLLEAQLAIYQYKSDSNEDSAIGALPAGSCSTRTSRTCRRSPRSPWFRWRATRRRANAIQGGRTTSTARSRTCSAPSRSTTATCRPSTSWRCSTSSRQEARGHRTRKVGARRDERRDGEARRRPAARARGARVLAGHPQEPELPADPQHRPASSRMSSGWSTARCRSSRPPRASTRRSSKRR